MARDRLLGLVTCCVLAVAMGGCAQFHDLTPCTGGCGGGGLDGLGQGLLGCGGGGLGGPCGTCSVGACSDCGGDPCSCETPALECESCAMPDFSLCQPNLLHALFGCTGCDREYYWSEWFSDPPARQDPCDDCGNWTGNGGGYQTQYAAPVADYAGPAMEKPGCRCGAH